MHFENIYADRAPNEILDELGWAEHLTPQDLSRALMQTLRIIIVQDHAISHMEARLRSIEEKLIPADDRDEDPATF